MMTVTMAANTVGLGTWHHHDVVLLPPLIPMDTVRATICLTTVLQQQQSQSQISFQAFVNYAMDPPQVSFSVRVEPPTDFNMLVSVMVFVFCFQIPMWLPCSPIGLNCLGLHYYNPSEYTHGRHICLLVVVCYPYPKCTEWLLSQLLQVGGALCY